MKRTVSAILIVLLLLTLLPVASIAQYDEQSRFYYYVENEAVVLTLYSGSAEELIIPDTIANLPVAAIKATTFSEGASFSKVVIPSTVEYIEHGTFAPCVYDLKHIEVDADNQFYKSVEGVLFTKDGLHLAAYPSGRSGTTYTIPNGTEIIDDSAFFHADNLTEIIIAQTVTEIEAFAFRLCSNLVDLIIPAGVEKIGRLAFAECFVLDNYVVAEENTVYSSVDGLILSADGSTLHFYPDCRLSTSFVIPSGVTKIGSWAFGWNGTLNTVTLNSEVSVIEPYAFSGCSALNSLVGSDGLTYIGDYAFQGCGFTQFTIPKDVTHVGVGAFQNCMLLTALTVDTENEAYVIENGVLFDKDITELVYSPQALRLEYYDVPTTVVSIADSAFYQNTSLRSVNLPEGLISIGNGAFSFSGLSSVAIPNSVVSIGQRAFAECIQLCRVTFGTGLDSIGDYAFFGCQSIEAASFAGSPPSNVGTMMFYYYISSTECAIVNGFYIEYMRSKQNLWAPNGETTWQGYEIRQAQTPDGSLIVYDGEGAEYMQPIMVNFDEALLYNIPIGTTAEQLAQALGVEGIELTGVLKTGDMASIGDSTYTIVIAGDVNCDAEITAADASKILRAIVKLEELDSIQSIAANTQGAEEFTASDASKILRWIVKYEFTIGKVD